MFVIDIQIKARIFQEVYFCKKDKGFSKLMNEKLEKYIVILNFNFEMVGVNFST